MKDLELFVDEIEGRLTAVIVRNGVVDDLYIDSIAPEAAPWAALYLGKVTKIDTKLDAAIVDLGNGISGLLPAKHVHHPGADKSEERTSISSLLNAGQMVVVQVKAEGKSGTANENAKLPRVTMKLYLQGLFLTYSPSSSQVTISRKVEKEETLALTARLKGEGGWIVRHHIDRAAPPDVEFESQYLQDKWAKVLAARKALGDKPGLLQAGPDAVCRALIDYGAINFEHIYAGNKKILDTITVWCAGHFPALATSKRLRLFKPEKTGQRLFDIYDIFGALEDLKENSVYLDDGSSFIIEPTSALTLVDVNQGSAESISAANQSAARTIARQCRLRGLNGAIVVDFINMEQKVERAQLLETVTKVFERDFAHTQVHGFTRLGLIELTRRRRTASLAEKLAK
jgi:ribonuclease G